MSRAKPSNNYIIVTTLLNGPTDLSELKDFIPNFHKRIYELKKMGFEFEEVLDTHTGLLCLDITKFPWGMEINYDTQTIKVGNYWREYKKKLEDRQNEYERLYELYFNASDLQILWFEFKESVKNYLTKLFK